MPTVPHNMPSASPLRSSRRNRRRITSRDRLSLAVRQAAPVAQHVIVLGGAGHQGVVVQAGDIEVSPSFHSQAQRSYLVEDYARAPDEDGTREALVDGGLDGPQHPVVLAFGVGDLLARACGRGDTGCMTVPERYMNPARRSR